MSLLNKLWHTFLEAFVANSNKLPVTIAQLPSAIGPQTAAGSVSVTPASDAVFTAVVSVLPATMRTAAVTGAITTSDGTVLGDATSAPITLTLPTAVGCPGRAYEVKSIGSVANALTLASAGGTIDGAATYVLAHLEAVTVRSDGTNWWLV